MSTILITGGAGFIGSHLVPRLSAKGNSVFIADVLHPQVHPTRGLPHDFPQSPTFLPFDVTHADPWEPLLNQTRPDVIVHLAAETGTGQSLTEASRHAMVNVVGTTRLLDALSRCSIRPSHLVLTSSRAVYGDGAWQAGDGSITYPRGRQPSQLQAGLWDHRGSDGEILTPLPSSADRTHPHPTNIYAATKLAQEHVLNAWCSATNTPLSILRLQNVYGPGQSIANSYTGVLTFMTRRAINGETIEVYEDGEIVRDFVYVDDVVNAILASIAKPPSMTRTVDIGSGAATTISKAASLIAGLTGAPTPTISGMYRAGDVRAASCLIDTARIELGYSPITTLEDGIGQMISWMRSVI